jgi:tetratricopeptide (TPR) repeat protein
MIEDFATALSRCSFARVLAPSATRDWNDAPGRVSALRELGVDYVLEGRLQRAGEALRVSVQLVETRTGSLVWSGSGSRPLVELADLQEELIKSLAAQIGVELHEAEMRRALAKPRDITAYEALQRALAHWYNLRLANFPLLLAEARRAVSIVPTYGPAQGVLAYALALQRLWTAPGDAQLEQAALEHAQAAVSSAPHDAMSLAFAAGAHLCLGRAQDAYRYGRRALEINPDFSIGQQQLGLACLRLGRNEEAIACFDAVEALTPRHASVHLTFMRRAHAFYQQGDLKSAQADMDRAFELNEHYAPTLVLRAGLCTLSGRDDDAIDAIERLRALEPATSAGAHAARALALLNPEQSAPLIAAFRSAAQMGLRD